MINKHIQQDEIIEEDLQSLEEEFKESFDKDSEENSEYQHQDLKEQNEVNRKSFRALTLTHFLNEQYEERCKIN